ncbi:hypothetical protein SDC9_53516 [bioreactor metagenome]|uniref:SLH domain-containing protein n=1 Tax=bioreactor metagenome TaxID=1076179 RepID=A0A644WTL8_9ZZZZ
MKRITSALLTLVMLAGLFPGTQAVTQDLTSLFSASREYKEFSDVSKNAWYYENVKLCYETGLLNGEDASHFDPNGTVTLAEAETVIARFHQILNGGKGRLPSAPDSLNLVSFLDENGKNAVSFDQADSWNSGAGVLYLHFSSAGLDTLRAGTKPVDKLTMTVRDSDTGKNQSYTGEYRYITDKSLLDSIPWEGYVFEIPDGSAPNPFNRLVAIRLMENDFDTVKDKWYAGARWYLCLNYKEFQNVQTVHELSEMSWRSELFSYLAAAVPDNMLTAKNAIAKLPDTSDADVLAFYNAGILKGTDDYGTFAGSKSLTRSELAAILSRLIRPSLRLAYTPKPWTADYVLTPISLDTSRYDVLNFTESDYQRAALLYLRDKATGKMGVMNYRGIWMVKSETYDSVAPFCSDGAAAVCRDSRWGYINLAGTEIVPCVWAAVSASHDGTLLAGNGTGTFTVYDSKGTKTNTITANLIYYDATGGLLRYTESGKTGYLNPDGTIALEARYYSGQPFSEGYAAVCDSYAPAKSANDSRLWGAIDRSGKLVIPYKYQYLGPFYGGFAYYVSANGSRGYVSSDGTEHVLTAGDQYPSYFSGGYAFYLENGLLGYLDTGFKMVVPASLESAGPIVNGQALVQKDGTIYLLTMIS